VFARAGAFPLGAVFGALGALGLIAVALLGLDRLPLTLCVFRALTGLPCPTCGATRAAGRLAELDVAGAVALNPLATALALSIAAWAVIDLLLLPARRAVTVEVEPALAPWLRGAAVAAVLGNWLYLLLAVR
jgi:hypothetical protein